MNNAKSKVDGKIPSLAQNPFTLLEMKEIYNTNNIIFISRDSLKKKMYEFVIDPMGFLNCIQHHLLHFDLRRPKKK